MSSRDNTISVIIPPLNEEELLPALLRSLTVERQPYEIIVADGGSTDKTELICMDKSVRFIRSSRGRGNQMNKGAAAASGEILFFIHADSKVPSGWQEEIDKLLVDSVVAGSFCLIFDKRTAILDFYARCSKLNHSLFTYGDQGLFLRADDFHKIGGFQENSFMEDVEILRRLRKTGTVVKSSLPVKTSARRFEKNGVFRQQIRNIALLLAYYAGISPDVLRRFYPYS